MTKPFQTKPYMLDCEEGQFLLSLGTRISIKASSDQTDGALNLFDVICPPNYTTPLHIHYVEDIAVYVLEGTLTFFWGKEKKQVSAGSFCYQPRGTPHGFCVGQSTVRLLYITFPAGFDRFVLDQQAATASKLEENAARHKIEILGPLPE